MYNTLRETIGKYVDFDAVLTKAIAMGGNTPSVGLMLALCMEAMAEKNKQDMQTFMDTIFIKTKSLQELEDEGRIG